jgi:tRNA(fMet)-specific endonuclease VapC
MIYVLDTNILIHLVRGTAMVQTELNRIGIFNRRNYANISIVSVGELKVFALRNQWGATKLAILNTFVNALTPISIDNQDIVDAYVDIDLYSQGKHPHHASAFTARNMGKNDLWIAATTQYLGATLVTADNDFNHLQPTFFKIEKIIL